MYEEFRSLGDLRKNICGAQTKWPPETTSLLAAQLLPVPTTKQKMALSMTQRYDQGLCWKGLESCRAKKNTALSSHNQTLQLSGPLKILSGVTDPSIDFELSVIPVKLIPTIMSYSSYSSYS